MNQDIYNRGIDLFRRIWINWVRMTHICVGKLTIIGSDNGLAPGQRQTIIWTNDGILLIGPPRNKLQWNLTEIHWRKYVCKCLRNVVHLVSISMC